MLAKVNNNHGGKAMMAVYNGGSRQLVTLFSSTLVLSLLFVVLTGRFLVTEVGCCLPSLSIVLLEVLTKNLLDSNLETSVLYAQFSRPEFSTQQMLFSD